jgi:phage/plasmid-associated DNA primase
VRWSELTRDERGGDSTFKRLAFKLMGARVALVEEMGESSTGHRVIEISTVKQLTGGGEITGAAMRQNEVAGEIKFKLLTLMNRVPHIEPDDAMKRRVQIFPFRASFDETNYPGCTRLAMERKNAPDVLRSQPERIESLMREEASGILFRWLIAARDFIADGEQMKITSDAIRNATAGMFREADVHGRFAEERLEFDGPALQFSATTEELNMAGEWFQRESAIPMLWSIDKLAVLLRKRGCTQTNNIQRDGKRKRGWLGVKLADRLVP